ncbi:MAG: DUF1592 domain-containing protein [Myxococcales bacterium]|nr:DUF1592 domain-containing protein [Myxococcales bacterium]
MEVLSLRGCLVCVLVALSSACTGRLGDDTTQAAASPELLDGDGTLAAGDGADRDVGQNDTEVVAGLLECEQRTLPVQPLRRLSSRQYENTLRDLFGPELARDVLADSQFPRTVVESGFVNDAEANVVNTAESNAIEDNAERIAGLIIADPNRYVPALLPCELGTGFTESDVDGCIAGFVEQFGSRAYRRPISERERAVAVGLYDTVRSEQTSIEALAAVVQLFVQAPALLYRVERGAGDLEDGLVRLSDYEMASRLSYFLTDSMPDAELAAEAAEGRLSSASQVATQARRLMESEPFFEMLEGFHRDWLRLSGLGQMTKNPELYPDFTEEVRASLLEETGRFLRYVLEERDGSVRTLLGSTAMPVNATLAGFYGVAPPEGEPNAWVATELPDRAGLLTLAAFQATQADSDRTSPIHRGVFFQKEVLCNELPPFPGDIDVQAPLRDTSMLPTARERLSPLLTNPSCAGCHTQFNPTGLAFENYDAAGLWRDEENASSIDASGTVVLDGIEHAFSGPLELVDAVAQSTQARECYTLQWFRYTMGRREFTEDSCSLAVAQQLTEQSDGDIRELLVALTQTDAFMYRRAEDVD